MIRSPLTIRRIAAFAITTLLLAPAQSKENSKSYENSYCLSQKWMKTAEMLSRRLELDPSDLDALAHRANCYVQLGAYPNAYGDYQRLVEAFPRDGILRCGLANIEYFMHNYLGAKRDFEISTQLGAKLSPSTLLRLGDSDWNLGKRDAALKLFETLKASQLDQPGDWLLLATRFKSYGRAGDQTYCQNKARGMAKDSIEFDYQSANYNLAIGDFTTADKYLNKLIAKGKHQSFAYSGLAQSLLNKARYGDAISKASLAIKEDPHNPLAFQARGKAYEKLGLLSKALRDYEAWQNLQPNTAAPLTAQAMVLFGRKQYKRAVEASSLALAIDEADAAAYGIRGASLAEVSRYDPSLVDKAREDLEKALRLSDQNFRAHMELGKLQYRQLKSDAALVQFKECLRLDPSSQEAKHWYSVAKAETTSR